VTLSEKLTRDPLTVKAGVGLIAFEENVIALLESVEDCLAKRRLLPCLILVYSGIDIISSLEPGRASGSAFMAWADKYLLKDALLACTPSDLYGARCGILHTFSAESGMSRKGQARQIVYAWGNAKTEQLASTSKELGRNDCVIHIRELINAFRVGLANYLEEVMEDDSRSQKLYAGASLWFTHMDQRTVTAFLERIKV
jgi:hypothetical protein